MNTITNTWIFYSEYQYEYGYIYVFKDGYGYPSLNWMIENSLKKFRLADCFAVIKDHFDEKWKLL